MSLLGVGKFDAFAIMGVTWKSLEAAMSPCYFHIVNFCMLHISKIIFKNVPSMNFTSLCLQITYKRMQPSTPTKKKTQRKIGKEAAGKQAAPKVPPMLSQGTTANPSTRNIPDLENVIGTSYSLAVSTTNYSCRSTKTLGHEVPVMTAICKVCFVTEGTIMQKAVRHLVVEDDTRI